MGLEVGLVGGRLIDCEAIEESRDGRAEVDLLAGGQPCRIVEGRSVVVCSGCSSAPHGDVACSKTKNIEDACGGELRRAKPYEEAAKHGYCRAAHSLLLCYSSVSPVVLRHGAPVALGSQSPMILV